VQEVLNECIWSMMSES